MTDRKKAKITSSISHPKYGEGLTEEEAKDLGLVTDPDKAKECFEKALNDRQRRLDDKQRRQLFVKLDVAVTPGTMHAFNAVNDTLSAHPGK